MMKKFIALRSVPGEFGKAATSPARCPAGVWGMIWSPHWLGLKMLGKWKNGDLMVINGDSMGFNGIINLVGETWNMTCIFPFSWECHHPNWLSYFSEGWNHQPVESDGKYYETSANPTKNMFLWPSSGNLSFGHQREAGSMLRSGREGKLDLEKQNIRLY